MNTTTRLLIAASVLAGLSSCQSYENMRNPQYDPMTGQVMPHGTKVTPAYAVEDGQTPAPTVAAVPPVVQPTAAMQPQVQVRPTQPSPQPTVQTRPQNTQRKAVMRNAGPFATPDVTRLPSKDDLKETETSTSDGGNASGVTAPKR